MYRWVHSAMPPYPRGESRVGEGGYWGFGVLLGASVRR